MTFVGVQEMTISVVIERKEGSLLSVIEFAIQEARTHTERSGGRVRTKVRFKAAGQTVTVGPDDQAESKYEELKRYDPFLRAVPKLSRSSK